MCDKNSAPSVSSISRVLRGSSSTTSSIGGDGSDNGQSPNHHHHYHHRFYQTNHDSSMDSISISMANHHHHNHNGKDHSIDGILGGSGMFFVVVLFVEKSIYHRILLFEKMKAR